MQVADSGTESGVQHALRELARWVLWQPAKASLFAAGFLIEFVEALSSRR